MSQMPPRHNSALPRVSSSRSLPDIEKGVIVEHGPQLLRRSTGLPGELEVYQAATSIPEPDIGVYTPGLTSGDTPDPVITLTGTTLNQPKAADTVLSDNARPKSRIDKNKDDSAEPQFEQKAKTQDEWASVMDTMTKHDLHMVQSGKEGIDSLLVFAGLFSTVLTAFNVVTFGFLQTDPNKSTPLILTQISRQLAALSINNSGTITSIQPAYVEAPPSGISRSMVAVNTLWFSSLVLSLTSASIGILVKQWLQEYAASTSSQVYDSVCIRQHRVDGYRRWRVSVFIKLLPFLLQLSLLLFFVGLVILLWSVNREVTGVVGGLVFLWLICWFATIVLPTIDGTCPYKSAEAWAFFAFVQFMKPDIIWIATQSDIYFRRFIAAILRHSRSVNTTCAESSSSSRPHFNFTSWREREMDLIKGCKPLLAWRAVEWTRESLMDEIMFTTALRAYVNDPRKGNMEKVVNYLWNQLSLSTGVDSSNLWSWIPDKSDVTCALMRVALNVLKVIRQDDRQEGDQQRDELESREPLEGSEQLIVALARYAYCRTQDAPDQDIIQNIKELPRLIDLGKFPLKDVFMSKLNSVKHQDEFIVQEIDNLAANYASVWFNWRKYWIIEDFDDFIGVSVAILQLVAEVPPDTIHGSVDNGHLKSFLKLLQDLGEFGNSQRAREMNIVHRNALKDLRRSVQDLAYVQPSLRDHLKDCITSFLLLCTNCGSSQRSRTVEQVSDSDEPDALTAHVLASELHIGDSWYALAMRPVVDGKTGMQVEDSPGLEFQLMKVFDSKGRVDCVCFSPDGRYVGEIRRKFIQIHDAGTLTTIATLCEHPDVGSETQCICFSPDSTSIAAATTRGAIKIWTIENEVAVLTLQEYGTCSDYLEFSCNGRLLLSKDVQGVVQVWNITDRSCMTLANMDSVYTYNASCAVVFSPRGDLIATGSADGFVHIWDVADGTISVQYEGHSSRIESVVFNPDQTRVISGSHDGTVKLWDVPIETGVFFGRVVVRDPVTLEGHTAEVTAVSVSGDGRWIVSGSDHNIYVWDAKTGVLRYFIAGHRTPVHFIKHSPTHNRLVTGDREDLLQLWEYKTT